MSLGAEHGVYGLFVNTLAEIERRSDNLAAAERLSARAVPLCRKFLDPTRTYWTEVLLTRALVLRDLGRVEEAEATFKELLQVLEDTRREGDVERLANALHEYAALLRATGRSRGADEAEARSRELLAGARRDGDPS